MQFSKQNVKCNSVNNYLLRSMYLKKFLKNLVIIYIPIIQSIIALEKRPRTSMEFTHSALFKIMFIR